MNRCSHPTIVCCWDAILYCCGIMSSYNNSDIVQSIVDPLGLLFHSSLLCVSPSSSAKSIPTTNRCRRLFGASISLIICSNVLLYSRWTSFLLGHRRMCRIVSSSHPSQHRHVAVMLSSKQCALAFVYHCWVYCFKNVLSRLSSYQTSSHCSPLFLH